MKASLIINLISAHLTGDENEFEKALTDLATDEEKKGNVALANQLTSIYKGGKKQIHKKMDIYQNSGAIVPQGITSSALPRDKDSLLELYEMINSDICLEDVILPKKQKNILMQMIKEQKDSETLYKHNIIPSNRLLLCGPPGCGKTMTAKAVATELGLPMAYVRLDGLVSSYLGQTSTNLRKVFDSVRNQRLVLFLDEFDAIAKKRDDAHELGELKRVVTTLLQNFDNMPENIFLIAATNHHHLLDPAIWRRFNVSIILDLPDEEQRNGLVNKWLLEYTVNDKLDLVLLSKITEGMNGAQIRELIISTAKSYLSNGEKITTEEVISILLQQLTLYSENSDEMWNVLRRLNEKGVGLRVLAKATGIAHTTLGYRIKNVRDGEIDGQQ